MRTLLDNGADPSIPENSGFTIMHGAAFRGRAVLVRLLAKHGAETNTLHKDGFAPLHRACWGNEPDDTETVRALLELGVPANTPASPDCKHQELCGLTPVAMARKHGNEETAALLETYLASARKAKLTKPQLPPTPPPPKQQPPAPKAAAKPTAPMPMEKGGDLAAALARSEAEVARLNSKLADLQAEAQSCAAFKAKIRLVAKDMMEAAVP